MATLNNVNPSIDATSVAMDELYNQQPNISSAEYDYVSSYLSSVCTNPTIAANLTDTIFRISASLSIPVDDIMSQITGQKKLQITATLAYYLNSIRHASTYLAVGQPQVPMFYAARNVAI